MRTKKVLVARQAGRVTLKGRNVVVPAVCVDEPDRVIEVLIYASQAQRIGEAIARTHKRINTPAAAFAE